MVINMSDIEAFAESNEYWDTYSLEALYQEKHPSEPVNISSMVKEYSEVSEQKPDFRLYAELMWEEYKEWRDELASMYMCEHNRYAHNRYEPRLELKELADLVYVIYGYANARGWDLDEAVRRVHENNLGRMRQPDGTIKRREDGKILRNKDYPVVDLSDLV